jgi:hypothetical protein
MALVSKKEFTESIASTTLEQIIEICAKDFRSNIRPKTRGQAIDEAYEVYKRYELAGGQPPQTPSERPAAAPPTAPEGALVYEGRLKATHHAFRKCGIVFERSWKHIGELSDEQVAILKGYPQLCEIRLVR